MFEEHYNFYVLYLFWIMFDLIEFDIRDNNLCENTLGYKLYN